MRCHSVGCGMANLVLSRMPSDTRSITAAHTMSGFAFTMMRATGIETHEHAGDFKKDKKSKTIVVMTSSNQVREIECRYAHVFGLIASFTHRLSFGMRLQSGMTFRLSHTGHST